MSGVLSVYHLLPPFLFQSILRFFKAGSAFSVPETDHNSRKGLVAASSGFSLHAGVHVDAGKKQELEKICRYIARPPIAEERLSQNTSSQIVYKLKKPYGDGTTHIVMSPMELMEKLASIVPAKSSSDKIPRSFSTTLQVQKNDRPREG
jgi:hypothetical protein